MSNNKKIALFFIFLCLFVLPYFVDGPKIQGELPKEFYLEFSGIRGNYSGKRRTLITNNSKTVQFIWEQFSKMKNKFRFDVRGGDWRITVSSKNSKNWINTLYLFRIENDYIFLNGGRYYKNDTLANYLMQQIEIDSIRILDKYKIENLKCAWKEEMKKKKFKGKVSEVLINKREEYHIPMIVIDSTYKLNLRGEYKSFEHKVEKGDYIEKNRGSMDVLVIRSNMKDSIIYTLTYGCENF